MSVDAINLFDLKKILMYAFFTKTLITDKEKSLIRQHEEDYNAHAVNKGLLAHMST